MKLRNLSIYFAVLVALIAWLYFWEIKHRGAEKAAKAEAEKIVHIAKDKIVEVDVQSKKNGKITIKKPAKEWVLAAPVTTKGDESAIDRLLVSAAAAKPERVIAEKDVKWEDYGLDKPELTVVLATADKKVRLSFGSLNPAKTSYYLRAGDDPRLFLVADTLKNSMDKSPFDLREKTVLGIAPEDVDRIVISAKGKDTEIKRQGLDKWRMLKPEQLRVKSSIANKALIDITNLQAKGIIDEPMTDGDPYGLDQPEEEITLAGKKLRQTLLVGKASNGEKRIGRGASRYARIKGREPVYEIDLSFLAPLKADPQRLQDKSIVDVKPTAVERLEIDLDGKKWIAVKGEDGTWGLESPRKGSVQAWEITSILWDLKGVEWKSMSKPTDSNPSPQKFDKPKLVIYLKLKDKKEPIILKAAWPDQTSELPDKPKRDDAGEKADKAAAGEKNSSTKKEPPASPPEPKIPETVHVKVDPHEEKGAVFTVDGRFVERMRGVLDELAGKK